MTTSEYYSRISKNKAYLEPDEVARLEKSPTNLRDRLLIRLLFHLGCRISEALALKVDDIDFTQSTVTIKHLKTRLKISCPPLSKPAWGGHTVFALSAGPK